MNRVRTNDRAFAVQAYSGYWTTFGVDGVPDGIYAADDLEAWEGWRELTVVDDTAASTEWGVRWEGADADEEYELRDSEADAQRVHRQYSSSTEVVSRKVHPGPWQVQP